MNQLITLIKKLPSLPGVYLFKDINDHILYIGKAKNLKSRVSSYAQKHSDWKANTIVEASTTIEHIVTKNELEALLLEAKLIQQHEPKFNVLLKNGQPYIYLTITKDPLPELQIVRNKKEKGVYFGPFLEKTDARRVFNFLQKTFRLKLCGKKIENGCLHYHMELCAGSCRSDFDEAAYRERIAFAQQVLSHGKKNFLKDLEKQINEHNKNLEFEKSKELHEYILSFEKVYDYLDIKFERAEKSFAYKHVWFTLGNMLFLFGEKNGVVRKKQVFVLAQTLRDDFYEIPQGERRNLTNDPIALSEAKRSQTGRFISEQEYLESFYRDHNSPQTIVTNFEPENKKVFEQFLQTWHKKEYPVEIVTNPQTGQLLNIFNLAQIQAKQDILKHQSLSKELQKLLRTPHEINTIDCFDISHSQGHNTVGSCIRFLDGKPDKDNFRKFIIKTVEGNDDYACLREIVKRRYAHPSRRVSENAPQGERVFPDLILIDGGKGQLNAVKDLFPEQTFAALAKREETLFSKNCPGGIVLNVKNIADQTLIALRDYAHHFAISFHRKKETNIL